VALRREEGGALHAQLLDEKHKVEKELVEEFGGWYAPKKTEAIKVKGRVKRVPKTFTPKKDNKRLGYLAGAPMTQIEWVTFNPGSRAHIIRCLKERGWKPTEHTENGTPKLDEEVIDNITAEFPACAKLATYLLLSKRLGQLAEGEQAWLKKVAADGCIHASYNPMGTVTSRAAHFDPNIGQVPAAASAYGSDCRELFTVPPGWALLGADMEGLEARCLAHYLAKYDGGAYGDLLLSGDPHWAVVQAIGFLNEPRDKHSQLHTIVRETGAKRGFYAMLYGAGNEKVGRIVLDACRLAKKTNPDWGFLMDRFFQGDDAPSAAKLKKVGGMAKAGVIEGIPGFGELMGMLRRTVEAQEDKGRLPTLPGLDGRRLPVRSAHSALNTLLQASGAILCKRWLCDAYDALIAAGLKVGWGGDCVFVGWIHDELQIAVRAGLEDKVGALVVKAAQEAGNPYGFRIKLDSQYKVGANWKDTH
jgi:DNA polymerase-1